MRSTLVQLMVLALVFFGLASSSKITFTLGKRQVKCFKDDFVEGTVSLNIKNVNVENGFIP